MLPGHEQDRPAPAVDAASKESRDPLRRLAPTPGARPPARSLPVRLVSARGRTRVGRGRHRRIHGRVRATATRGLRRVRACTFHACGGARRARLRRSRRAHVSPLSSPVFVSAALDRHRRLAQRPNRRAPERPEGSGPGLGGRRGRLGLLIHLGFARGHLLDPRGVWLALCGA